MKIYDVAYGELNDYSTIAMFVNKKAALSFYESLIRSRDEEPDPEDDSLSFTFFELHVNDSVHNLIGHLICDTDEMPVHVYGHTT